VNRPEVPSIELQAPTPADWARRAAAHLPELLADHAVCELQAAVSALSLVGQYPESPTLVDRLSALASEELRHFRRVTKEGRRFGVSLATRRRNPYAAALRAACRSGKEPERGLDLLLVSALIEARSHERFDALVSFLSDARLKRLYRELADAEARHGPAYLQLAVAHAGESATRKRLAELLRVEAEAIGSSAVSPVAVHGRA
jgi:tRNA-(ms[2]io[6]A)-hydroxylase